jgi:hypothetical protein
MLLKVLLPIQFLGPSPNGKNVYGSIYLYLIVNKSGQNSVSPKVPRVKELLKYSTMSSTVLINPSKKIIKNKITNLLASVAMDVLNQQDQKGLQNEPIITSENLENDLVMQEQVNEIYLDSDYHLNPLLHRCRFREIS